MWIALLPLVLTFQLVSACIPAAPPSVSATATTMAATPAGTVVGTAPVVTKAPGVTPTATALVVPTATVRPAATPAAATPAAATPAAGRPEWAALVAVWDRDLWLLSADGKQQARLSDDGGYSTPRASADGSRIVYVKGEGLKAEIGIATGFRAGQQLLTSAQLVTRNDDADLGPVWSPDGRTIAFTRIPDTNKDGKSDERDEAEVWLMDANGANQRRLAAGRDPAWSPEGLRLAFATNGTLSPTAPYRQDNAINLINTRGENEWSLVTVADLPAQVNLGGSPFGTGTLLVKNPAWRPGGAHVAFTSNGHTGLVMLVSAQGSDLRMLDANYEGGFGRVTWSPSGGLLAYESFPPSGFNEVVIYDPVGQRVGTIGGVRRNISVVEPAWSGDGKSLAVTQLEAEPYLGVASDNGANPRAVLYGRVRWPDWFSKRP